MKEVVLQSKLFDEKVKQKAMKSISTLEGVESIKMNMANRKITVTGDIDPVILVAKLREFFPTHILTVSPVNEEPKKEESKKADDKNIE